MPIERKQIEKKYLILCEGRDAEMFLIYYLNSKELAKDQRFSNEIQVLDFGGNENLGNFLMTLRNMDKFDQVTSLVVIRDAEKDYEKSCREIIKSLNKCGFTSPEQCGTWAADDTGLRVGFLLFPLNGNAGTLEDLCLSILSEKDNKRILSSIDTFLSGMESSYGRKYHKKHKNRLHMYLSSSDKYVTMPLGMAANAGAVDWGSNELVQIKAFLEEGFNSDGEE